MKISVKLRHLHIAPRKAREIGKLITGMSAERAVVELRHSGKGVKSPFMDLLNSAISNATNNSSLEKETLKMSAVIVGESPTFKRWRPVSRGQAHPIMKRTCHIKLVLEGKEVKEENKKPEKKKETKITKLKTRDEVSKVAGAEDKREKQKEASRGFNLRGSKKEEKRGFFKKLFRRKAGE